MPYLITAVFSFFGHFFKKFSLDAVLKGLAVASVTALKLVEFGLLIALLLLILKTVLFVFEKINFFFEFTNDTLATTSNNDSFVYVAVSALKTLGVFQAFNDVFSLFSLFFISFFVFILSSMLYALFSKIVSNVYSIWRIVTG